jgi:quinol monooxygenase YgiN
MNNVLIVVATLVAAPGHEGTVQAALEAVVPGSRAEAGCLRYELHRDSAQPNRFVMLEEWRDAAALRAHEATPHFLALVSAIGGLADVHIATLDKLA